MHEAIMTTTETQPRRRRVRTPEPPAQDRIIVKIQVTKDGRYLICGPGRAGLEYRPRHGIRGELLLETIDRRGKVYAYARIVRGGRWRLDGIAPDQSW
jgi:hypothetical protein